MKILIVLVLLLTGALNLFAQSDTNKAKIIRDIQRVMTDQSAAWNDGDIDGFMTGYWNSEKLLF
ncbi:MAG: DUF4440 domain-containing protein, partial [Pyrinomonadaceae bacterium]